MTEWPQVPLRSLTEQIKNGVDVEAERTYRLLGVRWYGQGPFIRETVTSGTSKAKRLFSVESGAFIYNRLFAGKGAFGLVDESLDGTFVSNEFPLFRCDRSLLMPAYLCLWFQQRRVWDQVEQASTGTTQSRSRWNETRFLASHLLLPEIQEQRRIVDLMEHVDTALHAMEREVQRLGDLYAARLALLVDTYASKTLASVVMRASAGGTPSRAHHAYFDGEIPWVKSGEVEQDFIASSVESISAEGMANSAAKWVPAGSTLVAMYGQGETKGRAGYVGRPVTTNQAVLALTPDAGVMHDRYLLHAVRARTASLRERAVGAAQPNLSKALVLAETVPVPDLETQEREAQTLDAVRSLMQRSAEELVAAQQMRATLLEAMLAGDLQLPEKYDHLMEAV